MTAFISRRRRSISAKRSSSGSTLVALWSVMLAPFLAVFRTGRLSRAQAKTPVGVYKILTLANFVTNRQFCKPAIMRIRSWSMDFRPAKAYYS